MISRTPPGEALTELILELFRLNGAMLEAGNLIAAPHRLTSARWQVMGAISIERKPLTVSQIARRMGLARQGVQRIVNDLKGLGMVALEPNLDHKRAPLISITDEGAKRLRKIDKTQIAWVNQLSDGLSERQIKTALNTLRAIRVRSDSLNNT
jgi:DNA-binding MarR family transcriptional regulator